MESSNSSKASFTWATGLSAAFAWFGYHCGSGFATGRQIVQYTTRHGWAGFWIPIVIWVILLVYFYFAIEFARLTSCKNYKDFVMGFYSPIGRYILVIWDAVVLMASFVGLAGILAAAGELINDALGIGYWPGVVIFAVVTLVLLARGYNIIAKVASAVTIPLIVCIAIVIIAGIAHNADNLKVVMSSTALVEGDSYKSMFKDVLNYCGTQSGYVAAFIGIASAFNYSKDTKIAVGVGAVINIIMHFGACLLLYAYYPDINGVPLAMLGVVKQTPWGFLVVVYQLMLFLALLSTSVTMVFGSVSRYSVYGKKLIADDKKRKDAWIAFIVFGSIAISGFGLTAIVNQGYKFIASFRIPIILIPVFFLGAWRISQAKKKVSEN